VNIELNNWTKKSARDLAMQAGFEKYYRIVYDPSSADLHGTWMSLRESNLMLCGEPLHRFHRLPGTYEPPAYVRMRDSCVLLRMCTRNVSQLESNVCPFPNSGMNSMNCSRPKAKPRSQHRARPRQATVDFTVVE
jgi:hypothetical protein